ncbi:hypothetical protein M9H77_17561 [Catharanthus roseus]|uniref:Uncharacterized protein n=1 Tax=Catharanthus roseus TaxID=4058 RepID=A0ACC0B4Z9_CATRO|nr:hypothetical protein M9H77_17561 [Catharanthus roseus]
MGLLSKKNEVPSGSRNDEKQTKTNENGAKTMKMEVVGKAIALTADGRATYHRRISRFVQDLFSWIQDFDLQLVNELPQAIIVVEKGVVLHVEEEITNVEHCDLMRDENIEKGSIEIKEKERVEEKERLVERSCIFDSISNLLKESVLLECSKEKESELEKSKRVKQSECLIENDESLTQEQEKEKQDEIEKSEETKEEMSLMVFEGDKREEMRESCCDISSLLNSLSSEEKFEAQNMENQGSLDYKLYKTITFLPSTSFIIPSQFLDSLTTICGTKSNRGMKAKGEGHEFYFKELNAVVRKCPRLSILSFSFQGSHVVTVLRKENEWISSSWLSFSSTTYSKHSSSSFSIQLFKLKLLHNNPHWIQVE